MPDDRYDLEVSGPELCNMIHDYAKPLWQYDISKIFPLIINQPVCPFRQQQVHSHQSAYH